VVPQNRPSQPKLRCDEDVTPLTTSAFALPDHLAAKAEPSLIGSDEDHFRAIAESLQQTITDLSAELDAQRRAPGGGGQEAMDRDLQVHRLTARLHVLHRFGLDLCLGQFVRAGDPDPVYVGRLGLTDRNGRRLLIDWRSPAAEPFFAATHANPMGLESRRRYRWTDGRISDYWDEVFTPEAFTGHAAALDDQSAFIASLGGARSRRMRDVLGTIQADQDAIIRAGSTGTLVVDGGPGTGKTVVALHRAAYLLYADPRVGRRREGRPGGVLFVGPHQPYLDYVQDVLPGLGEEGVRTCTLRDLVPGGALAPAEGDAEVARLKSSGRLVAAVEAAVRIYEEPPTERVFVELADGELEVGPDDWAEAFAVVEPGTPHNEARDEILDELVAILRDRVEDAGGAEAAIRRDRKLRAALNRAWPLLRPTDVVGDLWTVPAYLRACAPWLSTDDVRRLQRTDPQAWTSADLPFLDAARLRLGDAEASGRRQRHAAAARAQREEMARVVDDLIAADDSEMLVMSMLRGADLQAALADPGGASAADPDRLAGPFAHVVVDEAQELTDAEWQMLLARCPSRSFTVVGDRAQARHGFAESWADRLRRVGLERIQVASLTVNYRTPAEVMAAAAPVIRAALPDANVPRSIRRTGRAVEYHRASLRDAILDEWLTTAGDGIACVIGDPTFAGTSRVRSLTPTLAKGLEFDLVVLVHPEAFGAGIEGAVDRYVAMTRATSRLVVLA